MPAATINTRPSMRCDVVLALPSDVAELIRAFVGPSWAAYELLDEAAEGVRPHELAHALRRSGGRWVVHGWHWLAVLRSLVPLAYCRARDPLARMDEVLPKRGGVRIERTMWVKRYVQKRFTEYYTVFDGTVRFADGRVAAFAYDGDANPWWNAFVDFYMPSRYWATDVGYVHD